MITLLVDEGHAFDYLSILQIKLDLDKDNVLKYSTFNLCKQHLIEQIGINKFETIIDSQEYKDCYEANKQTFDAVDDAKLDKVPASYVDKCNFKRFVAKQKLQSAFFDEQLSEVKIGYDRYKD